MTKKLIAEESFTYSTKRLKKGDSFSASGKDARLLVAIGKAKEEKAAKKKAVEQKTAAAPEAQSQGGGDPGEAGPAPESQNGGNAGSGLFGGRGRRRRDADGEDKKQGYRTRRMKADE